MVAQTLRFNRSLESFRLRLTEFGLIHSLNITLTVPTRPRPPENPGFGGRGVLLDLGIHTLDLARYLTGTCPVIEACWLDHLPPAGLDTRANIRLSTAQGLTMNLLVAWSESGRIGTAEATGAGGRLSVDWVNDRLIDRRDGKMPIEWTEPVQPTIVAVLAAFLDAIIHNRPVPVSGQEGLEALKLVEACYRMATCRETVGPEQA
jgi:predicted dehydrogenase